LSIQAQGNLAIDFATMRAWVSTGEKTPEPVYEFDLPARGAGADPASWPLVTPSRTVAPWWGDAAWWLCNGLVFWRGKVWATSRVWYETAPQATTVLVAQDGDTITINLPRQKFAGFVKRGPGLDPLLGCGGNQSGQGVATGPTLATLDGHVLLDFDRPELPGANLEHWDERCPREPNYYMAGHVDSWVGWEPRVVNRQLQGRWASDRVFAGGLVLPEGVVYFAWMGTGALDYAAQTDTFALPGMNRTFEYVFDGTAYALKGWRLMTKLRVGGQEIGGDGAVYLTLCDEVTKPAAPVLLSVFA
jgi:hypothetical protein